MKNLDKLKKQNIRSTSPTTGATELSLDNLRQITGGTKAYAHAVEDGSCVIVR